MLRAREPGMISREKALQMIDAPTYEDAAKLLADCGYEDLTGRSAQEIAESLVRVKEDRIREIASICPDPETVDLFRLKYDYHNAKVLLKSEAMGISAERLFSGAGRIPADELAGIYREDRLIMLPSALSHAISEAKEVLARTGNPQAADFILDRAYYGEALELCSRIGSSWVTGLYRLMVDGANLCSVVRSSKLGKDDSFLDEVIMDGGSVSKQTVIAAGEPESVAAVFAASGPLREAAQEVIEDPSGPITDLEKAVDNARCAYIRGASLINYGPEVVVAYLSALEEEITAVRMIFTCRLAGVRGDSIKERLRDLYA